MKYEQTTKHVSPETNIPFSARKLGMDELQTALGLLTTPYEVDAGDQAAYMEQCAQEEQIVLKALAAHRTRSAGSVAIRPEAAERYGYQVMAYAEAMVAAIDGERLCQDLGPTDAEVIKVDFGGQLHFNESA